MVVKPQHVGAILKDVC